MWTRKINWHSNEGVEYYLTGRDKIKILEDLTFEYKGVYDPMIKTGYVLIKKEDIKNKNIQIKLDML